MRELKQIEKIDFKSDILNEPYVNELVMHGDKDYVVALIEELDKYIVFRFQGVCTYEGEAQYIWDFDDPYSTAENPQIMVFDRPFSTVQHLYRVEGLYTVRYMCKTPKWTIETVHTLRITEEDF